MTAPPGSSDDVRAALLLGNRLTRVDAAPLKAREFWALVARADGLGLGLGDLLDDPAHCTAVATEEVPAARLRTLLDATRAFAFEVERLDEAGVHLLAALDARFPARLRERLGHGCPPYLFVAGAVDALALPTLSIVGDDQSGAATGSAGAEGAGEAAESAAGSVELARRAAAAAVVAGWAVGVADPGPDPGTEPAASALDEAVSCDGSVVVLAAEGINRVARRPAIRKLVQRGAICLASPFPPDASGGAAPARARDVLLYAIGSRTFVVGCADGTGPTWPAAFDALQRGPGQIVTVVDDTSPPGNRALVELGAHRLDSVDALHGCLGQSVSDTD